MIATVAAVARRCIRPIGACVVPSLVIWGRLIYRHGIARGSVNIKLTVHLRRRITKYGVVIDNLTRRRQVEWLLIQAARAV